MNIKSDTETKITIEDDKMYCHGLKPSYPPYEGEEKGFTEIQLWHDDVEDRCPQFHHCLNKCCPVYRGGTPESKFDLYNNTLANITTSEELTKVCCECQEELEIFEYDICEDCAKELEMEKK